MDGLTPGCILGYIVIVCLLDQSVFLHLPDSIPVFQHCEVGFMLEGVLADFSKNRHVRTLFPYSKDVLVELQLGSCMAEWEFHLSEGILHPNLKPQN